MKNLKHQIIFFYLILSLFFAGCYEFNFVNQPKKANLNSSFTVPISVITTGGDSTMSYLSYFTVQIPIGWSVNDSIQFSDSIQTGYFIFSDSLTEFLTEDRPPEESYQWKVFKSSDSVLYYENTNFNFEPIVQTGNQPGTYYLDYHLGDSENGIISGDCPASFNNLITVGLPEQVVVKKTNDHGEGSLRHAIESVAWGGQITFDLEKGDTVTLVTQLTIYKDVTISGSEENVTITGSGFDRVFELNNYINLSLSNLNIVNGYEKRGAGIDVLAGASLTAENINITNNQAEFWGGGISMNDYSEVSLTNSTITGNYSGIDGGGIFSGKNSSLAITNVVIIDNHAARNGGGAEIYSADLVMENCVINENVADEGGGLNIEGGQTAINNTMFRQNSTSLTGGGINAENSILTIRKSIFENNKSEKGAGISSTYSNSVILNSLIIRNKANHMGGGIYLDKNSVMTLINATMTQNTAGWGGGSIGCYDGNLEVINSILYLDSPDRIIFYPNGDTCSLDISHSNIEGSEEGVSTNGNGTINWLSGNIDENPVFVYSGDFLYQLNDNSPCIDAGRPDTTGLNLPEHDLAGEMRLINGRVDMGAYEWNIMVGIEESGLDPTDKTELSIYPNPANHKLFIRSENKMDVEIFSLTGERVFSEQQIDPGNGIDISHLTVGTYFVRLQFGNELVTKKIVKL